ncbi:beta-ribofuranosylaminobenzene 5'-phosphate synthase family protein [Roseospira visakhapatnamensis]|uniref:Beta-ribofuranosylaminobenzene 5'-phosphate synthase n=1 Tax=Roseospira visakhapatnamensis TaxID=390880 RepID=A0A7W6R9W6_9PROT|nr:beta-ribofuranosylaminobenzene 5'-phosphate synthase family protein [Roseospira visakhapatnamensis]MBB4264577.1 beta-ribofuranosylaminobenzene 5'-phosphate synthase [Roseospira visakhapatnamensis]
MVTRRPDVDPSTVAFGLRVTAASRLSFTLIDLNGETGRRNGMASLSLRHPSVQLVARPADRLTVDTDANADEYRPVLVDFLGRMADRFALPPVGLTVERGLPPHHGFGSKTTTLLAAGKAYAALYGQAIDTASLARLAGRAGTSGASVNLIDRGGYLVDGGHLNPDDFNDDPQAYLLPSRFAHPAPKPPVLIQAPFPPWPILCIITEGSELHGKPELDWFRKTLPIPAAEARRTAHHVLLNLSTAVIEADYRHFCRALNVLTYEHHYKREQILVQPEPVQRMFREAESRDDIDAICISVTGPMCYAFTRDRTSALAWCDGLVRDGIARDFFFTNAQNHPAVIEGVPL